MNKKETLQIIHNMYLRCGELRFHMAVQHLFETGHQNFTEERVAEAKASIQKEHHKTPFLTPDFQCELLDCCLELSRLPFWDILLYIKLNLSMEGEDIQRLTEVERSLKEYEQNLTRQAWKDACADPDLREEILQRMLYRREGGYTDDEIKVAIRTVLEEK